MIEQNKRILDFKSSSKYILPSLQIFEKFKGNWERIKTELVQMAKDMKSTAEPGNIVSAYITPTLRNLNLIEGQGKSTKLTADALQCLSAYEQDKEEGFKSQLAIQLIEVDDKNVKLIPYLLENHYSKETAVSISQLKENLYARGISNAKKSSPIIGWFQLLDYVDLVSPHDGKYYILKSQYEALKNGQEEPSMGEFVNSLQLASTRLKRSDSPYIPIPEMRDYVCNKLKIKSFTFNRLMQKVPFSLGKTRIMFATPIKRVRGGIILGKKYYYYIAIFK